jgi:hypothetical protein
MATRTLESTIIGQADNGNNNSRETAAFTNQEQQNQLDIFPL